MPVTTRSRLARLAEEDRREEIVSELNRTYEALKGEIEAGVNNSEDFDETIAKKRSADWFEVVNADILEIIEYIRINEQQLDEFNTKIQNQQEQLSSLEKGLENINEDTKSLKADYYDLKNKINVIERSQDEKRKKEIEELRLEFSLSKENQTEEGERYEEETRNLQPSNIEKLIQKQVAIQIKELEKRLCPITIESRIDQGVDKIIDMVEREINKDRENISNLEKELGIEQEWSEKVQANIKEINENILINGEGLNDINQKYESLKDQNKRLWSLVEKIQKKLNDNERNEKVKNVNFDIEKRQPFRASSAIRSLTPIRETEKEENLLEKTLMKSINQIATNSQRKENVTMPKFSGNDREKPIKYLKEIKKYLQIMDAYEEEIKPIISTSLSGNAAIWWEISEEEIYNFEDFEKKFRERFWNSEIIDAIKKRIEGEQKYSPKGNMTRVEYTSQLISQAMDLETYSETELTRILANHHTSDIRFAVRLQKIENRHELLNLLAIKDSESPPEGRTQRPQTERPNKIPHSYPQDYRSRDPGMQKRQINAIEIKKGDTQPSRKFKELRINKETKNNKETHRNGSSQAQCEAALDELIRLESDQVNERNSKRLDDLGNGQ